MSEVLLQVYDLSGGMARMMSLPLIGKQIDGIWHTSIVVYNKEYYFGGGICCDIPLTTPYGTPVEKIQMGRTSYTQEVFEKFLRSVSSRFTMDSYHILNHNCNNFTDECARFLVSKRIPAHITGLPAEALSTPLGQQFAPMIESMMKMKDSFLPPGSTQTIDHWQDYASHEDYFPEYQKIDSFPSYDKLSEGFVAIVFWDPRNDECMGLGQVVQGLKCKVVFCDVLRHFYLGGEASPLIRVVSHGEIVSDYKPEEFSVELVNEMCG